MITICVDLGGWLCLSYTLTYQAPYVIDTARTAECSAGLIHSYVIIINHNKLSIKYA